ncbi:MAG: dihydroorotase family protein [Steroidobacteraceae bacterium]|nr:dihydroorotase family protein [Steroidobacteraceae bacterium]MDW8260654.1 dihydroorotase family protein [Gammaproteobacteria bacterium]
MAQEKHYDLLIKNVRLVRPRRNGTPRRDIAVRGGKIAKIAPSIRAESARVVFDGKGRLAFPGLVDPHMHCGIYSPLAEDAVTESLAAAQGGVTSSLNYMRTGGYYLQKGGPYAEFYPEVLEISRGRFHVDYAYHLAPLDRRHIAEIDMLVNRYGVTSFKIFMFYGGYGLHGASSTQHEFLMIDADEKYDIAHFEFVMRGVRRAMLMNPKIKDAISLSLHCELAEILNAYTKMVQSGARVTDLDTYLYGDTGDPACADCAPLAGLRAYSAARPPHSEGLAIAVAAYLAHETHCPNINLLHLTSRKAVEAALAMKKAFPHIDFRREVTIGHLCLDYDSPIGNYAKVNPPIRSREDVEYLWEALLDGKLDWVCSDHACCRAEMKLGKTDRSDIFLAKSGFGGTEYLLSALITAGRPRGLSYNRIAELTSWAAARRFGLYAKGDLAPGFDADIVLVDPKKSFVASGNTSQSSQGYSVFEGMEMKATVDSTFLRGELIWNNGRAVGPARGQYLHRPYGKKQ